MKYFLKKITALIAVLMITISLLAVQQAYAAENCCLGTLQDGSKDNLPTPDNGSCSVSMWSPAAKSVVFNPGCSTLPTSAASSTSSSAAASSTPTTTPGTITLENPLAVDSPAALIALVINAFLGLTGSIALIIFIYGGILWLTSAGDQGKVKKGFDTMIWAAIGLAVIFGSAALVQFAIDRLIK